MNKLLFTSLLACIMLCNAACSSPKITVDRTDAFSGQQIRRTNSVEITAIFNGSPFGAVGHIRVVGDTRMLYIRFTDDERFAIGEGAELLFKLDNDSIITLYSMERSFAKHERVGDTHQYALETLYLIPDDALETFQQHNIAVIRFYANDGYREWEVPKRAFKKLHKMFNLI